MKSRYCKVSALCTGCFKVRLEDMNGLSFREGTKEYNVFFKGSFSHDLKKNKTKFDRLSLFHKLFMQRLQFIGGNFRALELELP